MIDDRLPREQARAVSAGLCERCQHMQRITSARGSVFYLCRMSFIDPQFRHYPPIPVLACSGFAAADQSHETRD